MVTLNWQYKLKKNQYEQKISKLVPAYNQPNKTMEQELIKIGKPLVPSMIAALQYFKERLTWTQQKQKEHNSAITSDHLDWQEGAYQNAISSTLIVLKEITQMDFGMNDEDWENWCKDNQ